MPLRIHGTTINEINWREQCDLIFLFRWAAAGWVFTFLLLSNVDFVSFSILSSSVSSAVTQIYLLRKRIWSRWITRWSICLIWVNKMRNSYMTGNKTQKMKNWAFFDLLGASSFSNISTAKALKSRPVIIS